MSSPGGHALEVIYGTEEPPVAPKIRARDVASGAELTNATDQSAQPVRANRVLGSASLGVSHAATSRWGSRGSQKARAGPCEVGFVAGRGKIEERVEELAQERLVALKAEHGLTV
jgi:hypothetical protein